MTRKQRLIETMGAIILASLLALASPLPASAQQVHAFAVSEPDPASAIRAFGTQAGIQILASADDLKGKKFNPVSGDVSTEQGLNALLAGTGLDHRYVGDRAVALVPEATSQPADSAERNLIAQSGEKPSSKVPQVAQQPVQPREKSDDKSTLEEIIVTARKREENVMKVPIAVSVMTATSIQAAGVRDLADLAKFAPGLVFEPAGNGSQVDRGQYRIVFRGLSTDLGLIFIDGAPYAGSAEPDVTDVERVEVLKGPQSVYFGRATFSGAVNYVTKTPSNDFKGQVSGDFYSYDGSDAKLMVEGPLIKDLLTVRVSARDYTFGGQYRDGLDPSYRLGSQSTKSVSVALASSPTKDLHFNGYYSFRRDEDGEPESAAIRSAGPGPHFNCQLGGTGGAYWCGALPSLSGINALAIGDVHQMDPFNYNELVNNARGDQLPFNPKWLDYFGIKRDDTHAHLNVGYTPDSGWALAGQIAYDAEKYESNQSKGSLDTTNLPNPSYPGTPETPAYLEILTADRVLVNDASTELRLTSPQDQRLRGMIGGSYYTVWAPPPVTPGILSVGIFTAGGSYQKSQLRTSAVFGGVYFDVTSELKLGAEARYQWDTIASQALDPSAPFGPREQALFTSFSPRVTADYSITQQHLLYAAWSVGYEPGGFNPDLTTLTPAQLAQIQGIAGVAYKQEKIVNYEIGDKATWFDNRLRTTLALYYMKWLNGQVSNTTYVTNPDGTISTVGVVSNVGQVDLKGMELEAEFAPTAKLTLAGTLDYADNKIVNYAYVPNGLLIQNNSNVDGNQLDHAPKLSISLSPTYTEKLGNGWSVFTRADWAYKSKEFVDPTDNAWIAASSKTNVHLGFISNDAKFRVEGYVNNLFNDDHLIEAVKSSDFIYGKSTGCPPCYTNSLPPVPDGRPSHLNLIFLGLPVLRTFGVRMSYDF